MQFLHRESIGFNQVLAHSVVAACVRRSSSASLNHGAVKPYVCTVGVVVDCFVQPSG